MVGNTQTHIQREVAVCVCTTRYFKGHARAITFHIFASLYNLAALKTHVAQSDNVKPGKRKPCVARQ